MKTYRRKFTRKALLDSNKRRVESRDGILWAVYEDSRTCGVKIQGSSTLVIAHYPRNLTNAPDWLKIGQPVRIIHRGGERGFIEVTGPGRSIPTPVSGDTSPDTGISGDGIKYNMLINSTETLSNPDAISNFVYISGGTYSIEGTTYSYTGYPGNYFAMADPAPMTMGETIGGEEIAMGWGAFFVGEPPVDIGGSVAYRHDSIVVGIDGVTDVIVGTPATSSPVKPTVPEGHILINFILRTSRDDTGILRIRIGSEWREPYPVALACSHTARMSDCNFSCGGSPVVGTVPQSFHTFNAIDNYGVVFRPEAGSDLEVSIYMLSPVRGDIELGLNYISLPTEWTPALPHTPQELTTSLTSGDYVKEFTYSGEVGTSFMLEVTNLPQSRFGTDIFPETDIEDYDWEYPYDDELSIDTSIYECL